MTYHDSLLNRVERLARQAGRTDELVARLHQQEHDLRHARDAAVRELQELRRLRKQLEYEIETLKLQVDMAEARIKTLQGAIAADVQRLRDAEERIWPGVTWDCDAPDKMADEIETLRKQLADAKRAASDEFAERQVLTVEQQQDAAIWQTQVDSANAEVSYLRARLHEERSVSASLRTQLDAANAAVTLQRSGIERLQAFVGKVRFIMDRKYDGLEFEEISGALVGLDAEPTPVAEPLDAEGGQ